MTLVVLTLIWVYVWEGNFTLPPPPKSAKSETPNSPQSPDIGQNSDGSISDFQIFGQYLISKNCHNSRTSHDINMKLGTVTKLDNRNTAT